MEEDKILLYENIFFTREDIRNVQLAKAAIAAGIRTLLSLTGTKPEDISAFYIAGGFGTHLNLNSAIRIGLFPMEFKNKVTILGNAALKGAASMLTDTMLIDRAHNIVGNTECINLGGNSTFNKFYIDEMFFPEQ